MIGLAWLVQRWNYLRDVSFLDDAPEWRACIARELRKQADKIGGGSRG